MSNLPGLLVICGICVVLYCGTLKLSRWQAARSMRYWDRKLRNRR